MVFYKVKQKLRSGFNKCKRILSTRIHSILGISDKSRWSQKKSFHKSWDERTLLLSNQIKPNSVIFEFGAAHLVLKEMLPKGCTYLHSDIVRRNAETLVFDLNKDLPVIPNVDYIIFSGVLEYIFDVNKLIRHLSRFTEHIIFSYATTNAFPDKGTRHYNGWVSALSNEDIFDLASKINWKCTNIGTWKDQSLYVLKHNQCL